MLTKRRSISRWTPLRRGFLCPVGDIDLYRIELPPTARLLEVGASVDSIVSPVDVTWTVFAEDGVTALAAPAPGEVATAGVPLRLVHAIDVGTVLLQVRDRSSDAQDVRHPYTVTVSAFDDADTGEPNDQRKRATELVDQVSASISSQGDHDWYAFDATANTAATIHLSSEIAEYEPRYSVHAPDGTVILDVANPAATVATTDLLHRLALEQAGTWHILVQDDDDTHYDLDTPYRLSLALGDDPDDNEPNDHPASATPLLSTTCGGSWSASAQDGGYVATSGDIDWYELDVADCARGLVEANVAFRGALPAGFDAELRLLVSHGNSVCTLDQDCVSLSETCTTDEDCAGLGNSCGLDGYCEGAGVCLPNQRCGANLLIEQAPTTDPGAVSLSAPLFDVGAVWLGVSDHRGDTDSPDVPYDIDARVRKDPDGHEPNNLYTAGPPTSAQARDHDDLAVEIPVYNCIDPDPKDPKAPPRQCCSGSAWTEGVLSYDYDQDWFRYRHPCPGEDCMVRLHVQADAGPVDPLVQVWRGSSLWFDGVTGVVDLGDQSAIDVSFGGLDAADECFYAFQGHNGNPYWYHVSLRDTIFAGDGNSDGGTWDHSATQQYRICIETLANACLSPCEEFENGCGTP